MRYDPHSAGVSHLFTIHCWSFFSPFNICSQDGPLSIHAAGYGLAVYTGHSPQLAFALASIIVVPGCDQVFTFSPAGMGSQVMNRPPLKSRQQWKVPVPREETLVVREKFRKVGWR